jgi:HlyD family secretion protein
MERRVFTKKRVIGAAAIAVLLFGAGAFLLWPAYTNPQSGLYSSVIGFLNVQRLLRLPIPEDAGHPVSHDFEAPVLGEGSIQCNFYNVGVVPTARVKALKVEEGDQVKQGQVLAELDDTQGLIDLSSAQLAVLSAKAQLQRVEAGSVNEMQAERPEHDKINLEGFEKIVRDSEAKVAMYKQQEKDGASSRLELINAETALANAELNYEQAKASAGMSNQGQPQSQQIALNAVNDAQNLLREKQEALKYFRVTAPADGIIDRVLLRDGEFNQNSGNTGFIIASGMWFEADLDQRSVADLQEGMEAVVNLEAYTGRSLSAKVDRIIPIVTFDAGGPETKTPVRPLGTGTPEWPATFKIRLKLENAGVKLAPGMTGFTRIVRHHRALAVSRAAIFSQSPGKGVVRVVDGSDHLVAVPVTLGESDNQFVEITGGLETSNWVLVNDSHFLRDNDRVQVDRLTASQQVAKCTELTNSERNVLRDQLKQIDTKTQATPKADESTLAQRNALLAQLKDAEAKAQQGQENAKVAASQRDALQAQLNDVEAKTQQTTKNDERVVNQRDALQTQLNDAQAKAQQAQRNDELASIRMNALQVQLQESEAKSQHAQENAKALTGQRNALQAQLKDTQEKAQQTEENSRLLASQKDALQAQLKESQTVAQNGQKEDGLTPSRTNVLQDQLKEAQAEARQSQENAKAIASQRDVLQAQLHDNQVKSDRAQLNNDVTSSRISALQTQLHEAEVGGQQAQQNAKVATDQRDALQGQLKDIQTKAESAQKNAEAATSQRDALQAQLEVLRGKLEQVQKDGEVAKSQRDALQGQLKDIQTKAESVQKNGELATNQRDTLQAQLKDAEAKTRQAQKNGELAANQRDTSLDQPKDTETDAQQAQKNSEVDPVQPNTGSGSSEDTEQSATASDSSARTDLATQDDHTSNLPRDRSAKASSESKKGRHATKHHLAVRRERGPLKTIDHWMRKHLASG